MRQTLLPRLSILALMATLTSRASAQRLADVAPMPGPYVEVRHSNLLAPIFGGTNTPDHRWGGFRNWSGGSLGVAGAVAGSQLCHLSDSVNQHCARTAIGLGLLGVLTGGITGGLIGGSIPKAPPGSVH